MIYHIVDFYVPVDNRMKRKVKEGEKPAKYLDHSEKWTKLEKMNVAILQIVVKTFALVPSYLVKRLDELVIILKIESLQIRTKLKLAGILSNVLETWVDFYLAHTLQKNMSKSWSEKFTQYKLAI